MRTQHVLVPNRYAGTGQELVEMIMSMSRVLPLRNVQAKVDQHNPSYRKSQPQRRVY